MIKYEIFKLFEEYGTNTYIVWDSLSKETIIFDPASPSNDVCNFIEKNKLNPKYIINTHGHLDHIGGNDFFRNKYKIPVLIHSKDAEMLTNPKLNLSSYSENQIIQKPADFLLDKLNFSVSIGNYDVVIIHTPGHTKGSVSILIDKFLISGDTLFYESIGRTDLPGGDYNEIVFSIKEKLFKLPEETIVLPGHGPSTTIADEIVANPFVGYLSD